MDAGYALPAYLEGAALNGVKAALLERRGEDLNLAGEGVERLNGLGLQLLMAAFAAWRADGRSLRISNPSEVLRAALQRLNLLQDESGEPVS